MKRNFEKTLTLEKAAKFIQSYPKDLRFIIMNILYDEGLLEQKEYTINEIALLLGIPRSNVYYILETVLNKIKKKF